MRGLYVHIPFCSIKCFYCDFAAFSGQNRAAGRYLEALEREIELRRKGRPDPSFSFDTLYVGGGTPSELSKGQISRLLSLLSRSFGPISRFRESTFEANPESLTEPKLSALAQAGVTRLSLGLQCTQDTLLKSVGRRHTFEDFLDSYRSAKDSGAFALNVDLMYGLPGQSLQDLRDSVRTVLDLDPGHLSLYGLQVEDRTLFGKREVEVNEDLAREMFEAALDLLQGAGYLHYEISNFARPGMESLHNLNYWLGGEYLGLGVGAASFLGGRRSASLDRLEAYLSCVEEGRLPVAEEERLEGKARLGERVMLGLRLVQGMDLSPEIVEVFHPKLEKLVRLGLVERAPGRARLTKPGLFVANQVFQEFVRPFESRGQPLTFDIPVDCDSPKAEAGPTLSNVKG